MTERYGLGGQQSRRRSAPTDPNPRPARSTLGRVALAGPSTMLSPSREVASFTVAAASLTDPTAPVTVEEFKRYLNITQDDNDALLERMLGAALLNARGATDRELEPVPSLDTDPPTVIDLRVARCSTLIRVPDVRELTAITADGKTLDVSAVVLERHDNEPLGNPYVWMTLPAPAETLQLTGRFGFTTLPDDLADAIYQDAARRWRRRQAGWSDRVENSAEVGSKVLVYLRGLPADIRDVYLGYRAELPMVA